MTERPDFRTMDEEHRELVIKPRVDAFSSFLRSEWTRAPSADKVSEFLYANYHELLSTTRYFIEWGGFVAFMAYFVAMAGEDPSTLDEWQDRRRRVAQIDGMAALDKIRIATMIRNENPSAKMPQSVRDALSPLRDTTSVTLRLLNARVPRKRHREDEDEDAEVLDRRPCPGPHLRNQHLSEFASDKIASLKGTPGAQSIERSGFPPHSINDAIGRLSLQGEHPPSVRMDFWGKDGEDEFCAMYLDVPAETVDVVGKLLYDVQMEPIAGVRHLILENGTMVAPVDKLELKNARAEVLPVMFDPVVADALVASRLWAQEQAGLFGRGGGRTETVAMVIPKEADQAASITLNIGVEEGRGIFHELTSSGGTRVTWLT